MLNLIGYHQDEGIHKKEKRFIEDEIYLRQLEINRQNRELAVLRKNYAQVLVNAYKNKGVQNKKIFLPNFKKKLTRIFKNKKLEFLF